MRQRRIRATCDSLQKPEGGQDKQVKDLEIQKCRALDARPSERETLRGTGGVPGNEGVGEHVRTRSQSGFGPGEIAEQRFRTERRKLVSPAGPVLEKRTLPKVDPAV